MHRLAVATASATFALLLIGGVVHGTGSSLACPDWSFVPLCHGQLFPEMTGGILFEHGHRLFAAGVGVMALVLAALAWRRRREDPLLFKLALGAVLLVSAQGALGGLTVLLGISAAVSTAHLGTSMIFFALVVYLAWRTRPHAHERPQRPIQPALYRLLGVTLAATYAQIVLGGAVRHLRAGIACVGLPFCVGEGIWPAGALARVHMAHRLAAALVTVLAVVAAAWLWRAARGDRRLRLLVALLPALLAAQITLGVLSVLSFLGLVPVTVLEGVKLARRAPTPPRG